MGPTLEVAMQEVTPLLNEIDVGARRVGDSINCCDIRVLSLGEGVMMRVRNDVNSCAANGLLVNYEMNYETNKLDSVCIQTGCLYVIL